MEEIILVDKSFVTVTYYPQRKLGKVCWKRKPDSDEYRTAFLPLIEYSSTSPVDNFISDLRNQGVMSPDDRKWFEQEMLPLAVKHGLKRAAVIFDGNIFKQYYMNLIISASNKFKLPLKLFLSEEEALHWLDQMMEKEQGVSK